MFGLKIWQLLLIVAVGVVIERMTMLSHRIVK